MLKPHLPEIIQQGNYTVWKFVNFSATQIFLREINFSDPNPRPLLHHQDQVQWCLNQKHIRKIWVVSYTVCTVLQKLSKCEVKAWLCWNLIVLPPLRFYVKPNFGEYKQSKMAFLAILEALTFNFGQFEQFFKSQIYQISKFRSSIIVKKAIFEIQHLAKLISCKIQWQINSWIVGLNFTFS